MTSTPILVVHGGAGDLESEADRRAYAEGVRGALAAGRDLLHDARAAVRAAVTYMESHTIMNAGRGAALASDGRVALDAGFMCGRTRRYGGVTGVRRFENPVLLAEALLDDGDFGRFVAPPDSDALIEETGRTPCDPASLVTERARTLFERRRAAAAAAPRPATYLDTVGAVALDAHGHVAAAVSTGGISMKRRGRIGDSPVVGAGFWADDRVGACVTTGLGEALLRQGSARRCVQLVGDGRTASDAAAGTLAELLDFDGDERGLSGLILVTREGEPLLDHNSAEMSGGWIRPDGSSRVTHLWR